MCCRSHISTPGEDLISTHDVEPGVEHPEYYLTPVADDYSARAEDVIRLLLGQGRYVLGDSVPVLKRIKDGDGICFYLSRVGVVAEAVVASRPQIALQPFLRGHRHFPYEFRVERGRYFFDTPVKIDAELRGKLDAFRGVDPRTKWATFVRTTRSLSRHDFELLVGRSR